LRLSILSVSDWELKQIAESPGFFSGVRFMGKGDRRSKRGKIFRGTFGKRRPKPSAARKKAKEGGS
jgi:30S ribosomal protein S31